MTNPKAIALAGTHFDLVYRYKIPLLSWNRRDGKGAELEGRRRITGCGPAFGRLWRVSGGIQEDETEWQTVLAGDEQPQGAESVRRDETDERGSS